MINKLVEEQLKKVEYADLSNFDKETNTFLIKKRVDIKIEVDKCYLVQLKDTLFYNETLRMNWNNNTVPPTKYLKIDVSKIMNKMIKVVAVGYDYENQIDLGKFWNGWLTTDDLVILQAL